MHIRPVFIMGCQRSGTTMLASQLGKAEHAIAFPEMEFVHQLISPNYRKEHSAEKAYEKLVDSFRYKASGLQIERSLFIEFYNKDDAALVVKKLVEVNCSKDEEGNTLIWIEHNPQNRDKVNELVDCFPDAKFIHIIRDPRAIYWSMKNNPRWNVGEPTIFTAFWNQAISQGYLYCSQYSKNCIEVNYEHFVQNTSAELKRICAFIDIVYSDDMLNGGGVKLPKFTQYQHALTERSSDASRLELWKGKLTNFEEQFINSRCYDWMYHYGYIGRNRVDRKLRWSERIKCFLNMICSDLTSRIVTRLQNWKSVP